MISITSLIKIVRVLSFLEGDILFWISFLFFLSFFTSLYFVMVILSLSIQHELPKLRNDTFVFFLFSFHFSKNFPSREKKKYLGEPQQETKRNEKKFLFLFFFLFFRVEDTPIHPRIHELFSWISQRGNIWNVRKHEKTQKFRTFPAICHEK